MDMAKPSFISESLFRELSGLSLEEASQLQFYLYKKGWVKASYHDCNEVPVYVEGYFPAKLVGYRWFDESECSFRFKANLESEYAQIGLTEAKRKELFLFDYDDISEVYFDSVLEGTTLDNFDIHDLYLLDSDLFDFCSREGIFDAKEKYNSLTSKAPKDKLEEYLQTSPKTETSPRFHSNTSEAFLDLSLANDYFWKNYDPKDPRETAPTKEQVVEWFIERGYAKTLSEKMDTILRGGRNKPGGRPENT